MPGIFGFTHPDANENTRQLFGQMAAALHDEPQYKLFQHVENEISIGRVGMMIIQEQPQPAWNEAHTIAVVMEGEIYDYDKHRPNLEKKGHQFITNEHAELFAHFYEEEGAQFVNQINGAFVAAIWDRTRHCLTIINDHLRLLPLYYTPNLAGGFAFASGVRSLLTLPQLQRKLDRLAVAQFLTFDHVLDDRTLLEDVKLLPGGSILTHEDGSWSIQNYWRPQYPEYYPVRSEREYQNELLQILRRAINRNMPGQHSAGILMSGGFDSRVIAALFQEQAESGTIQTFTMGQPACDDERYAKEVSATLGMPHYFYRLNGDYLRKYANQGVRLSDGTGNIVHMHTLPNLDAQAQRAEIIYKGFLGDALIGHGIAMGLWAQYDESHLLDAQFAVHRDQGLILFKEDELDRVMRSNGRESFSKLVMESYLHAMLASQTKLPADQRNYFDLVQRVPRMTLNGVEWVRSRFHVRLPFADRELVEFLLTVPPGYRFGRKIIKDVFVQKFPDLAKIPYTETNYPMIHCRREVLLRTSEQTRWWLRSLGLRWVPIPGKRPYALYKDWFRNELRSWIEGILLDKRTIERDIFDRKAVELLLNEHMSGQQNHHKKLGALISIELWHRQFMDGNKTFFDK